MAVHCRLWGLHILRCPRLNFNKTKNIRVPADEIDLSAVTWRAEIARHNRIAQLSQVEVSVFLTLRAGALMSRPRVSREHVHRNPIEAVNNRSREAGGKHMGWLTFTVAGEAGAEM